MAIAYKCETRVPIIITLLNTQYCGSGLSWVGSVGLSDQDPLHETDTDLSRKKSW